MRFTKITAGVLGAFFTASVTAQTVSLPTDGWNANGNWSVDYANNECAALLPFQAGKLDIVFGIRPRPILETAEIVLVIPGKADTIEGLDGKISFGAGEIDHHFLTKPAVLAHHILYTFDLSAAEYASFMQASQLRLAVGKVGIRLPFQRLADVKKVLDECEADLLATWGLSREVQAKLASFPKPTQEMKTYFRGNDYPNTALDAGNIGGVEARLTVAADGTPRDCRLVNSSGHKDLDQITCKLAVDRMHFIPARTKDGEAIESPYYFYLNWFIVD